jgi:hypothetical protein
MLEKKDLKMMTLLPEVKEKYHEALVIVHASPFIKTVTEELRNKIYSRVMFYYIQDKPVFYLNYLENSLPDYLNYFKNKIIFVDKYYLNKKGKTLFANDKQAEMVKEELFKKDIKEIELIGGYIRACLLDICCFLNNIEDSNRAFLSRILTEGQKKQDDNLKIPFKDTFFKTFVNIPLTFENNY